MMKPLALLLVLAAVCPARDLRVMTYNIRNAAGPQIYKIGPWEIPLSRGHDQLDAVAAAIKAANPDIVMLQEVEGRCLESLGQDQAAYLAKKLGYHHAYFTASEGGWFGAVVDKGNAVLSRWKLADARERQLSEPDGDAQARNVALARVLVPDVEGGVLVGSTHWSVSPAGGRQSAEANGVVEEMSRFAGPVIFGGDTNARPDATVMTELAASMAAKGKPVVDTFAAVGEGPAETYSSTRPEARIDYVFVSSAFTPVSARVLRDVRASDHMPLLVQLSIGPAPLAAGQALGLLGIAALR